MLHLSAISQPRVFSVVPSFSPLVFWKTIDIHFFPEWLEMLWRQRGMQRRVNSSECHLAGLIKNVVLTHSGSSQHLLNNKWNIKIEWGESEKANQITEIKTFPPPDPILWIPLFIYPIAMLSTSVPVLEQHTHLSTST